MATPTLNDIVNNATGSGSQHLNGQSVALIAIVLYGI